MFDEGGAAFDPVAVVAVEDSVHHAHLGVVDVAADDAVEAASTGLVGQRGFEAVDGFDGAFDLLFQPLAEGPVGVAEPAAGGVEPAVDDEGAGVGAVAEDCEELGVAHDAVELVAVDDQQALAGCGGVFGLGADGDAGDFEAAVFHGRGRARGGTSRRDCRGRR